MKKKLIKLFNKNLTTSIIFVALIIIITYKGCSKVLDYKWSLEGKGIAKDSK
jgi:uncharacterized protein YceK